MYPCSVFKLVTDLAEVCIEKWVNLNHQLFCRHLRWLARSQKPNSCFIMSQHAVATEQPCLQSQQFHFLNQQFLSCLCPSEIFRKRANVPRSDWSLCFWFHLSLVLFLQVVQGTKTILRGKEQKSSDRTGPSKKCPPMFGNQLQFLIS